MKTIIHLPSWEAIQRVPNDLIAISHLITYSVQTMNGEYAPRVVVYKTRNGMQGHHISHEQLQILQDAVLNDKPLPEFMKSNWQKAQEICDELKECRNSNSHKTIQSRLKKLESDLFPPGHYYDITSVNVPTNKDRLSIIEKKLGVVQSPGDDLGRLENCEFHLKNTYWRLRKLDDEIYPTKKDVEGMPATITYDGWMKRLEEKLGVDLAFTSIDHRLRNIEKAWREKQSREWHYGSKDKMPYTNYTPYVPRCIKHQQAFQDGFRDGFRDGLQEKFGNKTCKYNVGDTLEFHTERGKVIKTIGRVGSLYLFTDGTSECSDWVDKNTCSICKVTPLKPFTPEFSC